MMASSASDLADLRCSTITRAGRVDPIGTAGSYNGFLLVEWPLPWPRDAADIPALAAVAASAKEAGVRLQAVVPQGGGERWVSLHTWRSEHGCFTGREAPAGSDPTSVAMSLLCGDPTPGARPVEVTDVLVCGHGRRDRCCGSLGTALEVRLRSAGTLEALGIRLRRTSHTGGHRFAPTAIILPEGTCWAYLDADALTAIATRQMPLEQCLPLYRGCAGMSSPLVQAVERAVLATEGWKLLAQARTGRDLGDGRVFLDLKGPGGDHRRWHARVVVRRMVPVPRCGSALNGDEKTEPELEVTELEEHTA